MQIKSLAQNSWQLKVRDQMQTRSLLNLGDTSWNVFFACGNLHHLETMGTCFALLFFSHLQGDNMPWLAKPSAAKLIVTV